MKQAGQMKRLRHCGSSAARRNGQHGQAYAEYLVITGVIAAMVWAISFDPRMSGVSLVLAFKSLFSAYSFTLSLP
ncbi:hypothetical protein [Paraburkholderia fungorum]|uniref:hypothetical protein n=1 Tax=Paraburkholderia fungorum TaxID=134537 RepID=UPI0038B87324